VKIIPAKSSTTSPEAVEINSESISKSLEEYSRLKMKLIVTTIIAGITIGMVVWLLYGWTIALSYAVGALVGTVYFRMLAKSVDRLGGESKSLGFSRLGLFVVLMVIAAKSKQLEILPAFLGFMTYKLAVLVIIAQDLSQNLTQSLSSGLHSR
jgi:ATP synthase protein I